MGIQRADAGERHNVSQGKSAAGAFRGARIIFSAKGDVGSNLTFRGCADLLAGQIGLSETDRRAASARVPRVARLTWISGKGPAGMYCCACKNHRCRSRSPYTGDR